MLQTWELIQQEPLLWLGLCVVVGLLVGSFLNVVIVRLPLQMHAQWRRDAAEYLEQTLPEADKDAPGIVVPASHCPQCRSPLRWWHNIPLLSFVLLKGRCHACGATISWQYPLVEALAAGLALWAGWLFGPTLPGFAVIGLGWTLLTLTVIDQRTQLLPDIIVLPLLWVGLLLNLHSGFVSLEQAVVGAVAGYMSLWIIYQLFKLATGKEGMGFGDFKLLAALGAWFGWMALPAIVLLSSMVGLVWAIALRLRGSMQAGQAMPFGPFLAIAGWIYIVAGDQLLRLMGWQ